FDDEGKIIYLGVGDDQFAETEGFGARALTAEEQYPFIGAQMPMEIGGVDTLTGATFTKTAIVNGLNKAYAASKGEVEEEPIVEEVPAETKAVAENIVTASAQGFGGPVAVEAAFDDEGKITSIKIGDDSFAETPGLGARALEDEFQAQFIGKQMPLTLADIDAIAGATVTSTAVVDALNEAYASTGVSTEPIETPVSEPVEEPAVEPVSDTVPETEEEQELPVAELLLAKNYGTVAEIVLDSKDVQVRVTKANGVIAGLSILEKPEGSDQSAYTVSSLDEEMKNLFLAKTLPLDVNGQSSEEAAAVANAINVACGFETQDVTGKEEAPQEEKQNEPEIQAQPEAKPEAAEEKPKAAATLTLRVTVEAENDVLTALTVLEKAVDSEEYIPCAREDALKEKFIGMTLPLETTQSSMLDSVAAIAINKAYFDQMREAEDKIIGGADSPTVTFPAEPGEGEPVYYGEAIAFFTSIRAKVKITPAVTVEEVEFEEKQVGEEAYRPSERNDQLEALFVGEALPLDVDAYDDPYKTAAAIAVNEAFRQSPEAAGQSFDFSAFGIGESISFFTEYNAAAAFENGVLTYFGVYKQPIGNDQAKEAVQCDALGEFLIGQQMPLSIGGIQGADMPEYEVIAIEIALNQAYVDSLAGLQ
ncbi:MAG: FMN-binding protein, partial [Clostridia bacterium]|nr:FMN-binding protein [Clostridia bacterium]